MPEGKACALSAEVAERAAAAKIPVRSRPGRAARPDQTLLAFDFGERFIGVAVGEAGPGIAKAAGLIEATTGEARFAKIDALVHQWTPAMLVVGLPLAMDGGEQTMSARARRFARQLAARYRLPVALADERLSSAAAAESLRGSGRGGRKNRHRVHAEAARIILQGYLDDRDAARG